MAPIIHCVRHAQGVHNLSFGNHDIPDPSLTPFGEEQCANLSKIFPYHDQIELLVSSPIRRALQTTLLSFGPETARGLKIIALPETQEASDLPCDTGTNLSILEREFKDSPIDFSIVDKDWNVKTGKWEASAAVISERARAARQWLKARPEKEAVLVTHGCFLHFFTDEWTDTGADKGTSWLNAEFRSYSFVDDTSDNATLIETEESRQRRGLTGPAPSREEQAKMRETAIDAWATWEAFTPWNAFRR